MLIKYSRIRHAFLQAHNGSARQKSLTANEKPINSLDDYATEFDAIPSPWQVIETLKYIDALQLLFTNQYTIICIFEPCPVQCDIPIG